MYRNIAPFHIKYMREIKLDITGPSVKRETGNGKDDL